METGYIEESVRTRLILAGISELEEHGISDFSLRRAALMAQVSCAAPYRHFKDKNEFINEIVKYVNSKWELLVKEINKIFLDKPCELAREMCIAAIRFRIANKNFRTVFMLSARSISTEILNKSIVDTVNLYADYRGLSESERAMKIYTAEALIAGSLVLSEGQSAEKILSLAKEKLKIEFE